IFSLSAQASELQLISTVDLQKAITAKTTTIFDANSKEVFEKNHIPSATFFDTKKDVDTVLPTSKDSNLVFYCKNTKCQASHMAARMAIEKGFKNVKVYADGIDGWIKAGQKTESAN
ncbi:hypothetical protein BVY03_01185, partial [bacterium K02(2017)]